MHAAIKINEGRGNVDSKKKKTKIQPYTKTYNVKCTRQTLNRDSRMHTLLSVAIWMVNLGIEIRSHRQSGLLERARNVGMKTKPGIERSM